MLERMLEMNVKPGQKIKVEVSRDIVDHIKKEAEESGMDIMGFDDNSFAFVYPDGRRTPKMYVDDNFKKGEFRFTLVDA